MKRIFRSIVNVKKGGNNTIKEEELLRNYRVFLASNVKPEDPSYIKIYHWIEAHYRGYKEIPSIEFLFEKATKEGDEAAMASLKDIATETPFMRSDYKAIIKEKFEEQNKEEFRSVLQKTWQVVDNGLKLKKNKEIKGLMQAIEYFSGEARQFKYTDAGVKTTSQIRSMEDSLQVIEEYKKKKMNPVSSHGMFAFLDRVDDVFRGTKLGELMVVAAFVSHGKTAFAANLAYNGVMQGFNGMYVSLEMNFDEMRDYFYCLHTCFPEWYDHPKYKNLAGKLAYTKIRYGELSDVEQEFFEHSCEDFPKHEGFGELVIYQPEERLTPSRLELEMETHRARLAEEGKTLDFVIVDYVGLMGQDKSERYGDFNTDMNNIIKRLKTLTISFDSGRGLRIITPFQVNREGWKEASKNDGVYKINALSNANEGERASDQVVSLFVSEENLKAGNGVMKVTCLKNRHGPLFQPFEVHLDNSSRRIRDFIQKTGADDDLAINEIPLDM